MLHLVHAYRGAAALLVVLFHGALISQQYFGSDSSLGVFGFGWSGVQFFFVLSGFIIYFVHSEDIGHRERIGHFLRKRVIRIYPLYILVTLALAPFWLFVPSFGESFHKDPVSLLLSLLLIAQPHQPHLAVAWTLTHEMLFYVLFAVLIASKRWGSMLLIAWFAAIAAMNLIDAQLVYPWAYFFSVNNLLFGLGIVAAILATRFPWKDSYWWALLSGVVFITIGQLFQMSNALILAFGFASFALLLQAKGARLSDAAAKHPLLMLLGDASYAIYLVHLPMMSILCKLIGRVPTLAAFVLVVLLAVGAGVIAHLYIERPLLNAVRTIGSKPRPVAEIGA